jgi:hypothetical protein
MRTTKAQYRHAVCSQEVSTLNNYSPPTTVQMYHLTPVYSVLRHIEDCYGHNIQLRRTGAQSEVKRRSRGRDANEARDLFGSHK